MGVKPRRTFSDGTGYQVDLYRIPGVPDEIAQHFEKSFMRMVDTDASRALEKILSGDSKPWSGPLRSAWTRFILSLLFRNPEAVALLKGHIVEMWDVALKALEESYNARRRPDDPETFKEYQSRMEPHAAQIGASNFLAEVINSSSVAPVIFWMHWSRIDLSRSKIPLLTSDRPLDMPLGLKEPNAYIALPVSPTTLFLAVHDAGIAKTAARINPTELVRKNNQRVIEQARKFVWGRSDAQLLFIRRHFGKLPDRVIITPDQQQDAIEAAEGRKRVA